MNAMKAIRVPALMHTGRRSARLVETMGLMLDAALVDVAAVLQGEAL